MQTQQENPQSSMEATNAEPPENPQPVAGLGFLMIVGTAMSRIRVRELRGLEVYAE